MQSPNLKRAGEGPAPLELCPGLEDSQDLATTNMVMFLEGLLSKQIWKETIIFEIEAWDTVWYTGIWGSRGGLRGREAGTALCRVYFNHSAIVLKKETDLPELVDLWQVFVS